MWARTGGTTKWGDPATDVTEFEEHGITGLVRANNKRRPGRSRIVELLKIDQTRMFPNWHQYAGQPGSPRMFIVAETCPELVRQLQDAPLLAIDSGREGAGEIIDPQWESHDGHAVAACRYGAMSRPSASDERELPFETEAEAADWQRREMLKRYDERWENRTNELPSYTI
jgi:hypothetical protein